MHRFFKEQQQHLLWMPPSEGVRGTSDWEKTPGHTHNTEGLHIPSGLETPWDPPGGAGGHGCEEKMYFFFLSSLTTRQMTD